MSKEYFNKYTSPNIVIVPTVKFIKNPAGKPKTQELTEKHLIISESDQTKNVCVSKPTQKNVNMTKITPDVTNSTKMNTDLHVPAPANPEGACDNVIKEPIEPQMEKTDEGPVTNPPKVVQNSNKQPISLENAKLMKPCNSWASNYLQSIGQSGTSPSKQNSAAPGSKDMQKNSYAASDSSEQIKLNLLSRPKKSGSHEARPSHTTLYTGFKPRMDTVTWLTQLATSSNAKVSVQAHEPVPVTQLEPKNHSAPNADSNRAVLPSSSCGGIPKNINTIPQVVDKPLSSLHKSSTATDKKCDATGDTLNISKDYISKKPASAVNYFDCLDKIFSDIKKPKDKYDTNTTFKPIRSRISPNTRHIKTAKSSHESSTSKRESIKPCDKSFVKIDGKSGHSSKNNKIINPKRYDCDKQVGKDEKKAKSSLSLNQRQPNYNERNSIHYKDKNNIKSKTQGLQCNSDLEQLQKKRIHRDTEIGNCERRDGKKKKLSHATNTHKIPKSTGCSSEKKNDGQNDSREGPQRKRKRSNSENGHKSNLGTKKMNKHTCETPQKKKIRPNSEISTSKSNCSVKSVVKTPETHSKPLYNSNEDDFDLRSKLNYNRFIDKHPHYSKVISQTEQNEKPRENLRITINRSDEENTNNNTNPTSEPLKPKPKCTKYKKIKLIINVLCQDKENNSDSSSSDESNNNCGGITNTTRSDLSFLDDFNIDEIVNSLTRCQNDTVEKVNELPRKIKNTNVIKNLNNIWCKKKFVQPIIIKKEIKMEEEHSVVLDDSNCVSQSVEKSNEVKLDCKNHSTSTIGAQGTSGDIPLADLNNISLKDKVNEDENDVKQQKNNGENCNTDCTANQNIVNVSLKETENTVLENIVGNIKQENSNDESLKACTNNSSKDIIQHKVLEKIEACLPELYVENDMKHNEYFENNADYAKQNSNFESSPINMDDSVQIIDDNIVIIDLTVDEPQFSEPNTKSGGNIVRNKIATYEINIPEEVCTNEDNDNEIKIDTKVCNEIQTPEINILKVSCSKNENKESKKNEEPTLLLVFENKEGIDEINVNQGNSTNKENNNEIDKKETNEIITTKDVSTTEETHKINLPEEVCTNEENNNELKIDTKVCNEKQTPEINILKVSCSKNENMESKTTEEPTLFFENKEGIDEINVNQGNSTNKENNNEIDKKETNEIITTKDVSTTEESHKINLPEELYTNYTRLTNDGEKEKVCSDKETFEIRLPEDSCSIKEIEETTISNGVPTNTENSNKIISAKTVQTQETHEIKLPKNISNEKQTTIFADKSKQLENFEVQSREAQIEKRIFDYMRKKMTVTSLISHGKFSEVFKCNDTSGKTYAIKITTNNSPVSHGVEKENMIKNLQKDVPRKNLNTVYLINGFGLNRSWCFLMEYYPINLQQALNKMSQPFHIDEVQSLSRQLVSAVMMLRNNNIVHADIKQKHILLDAWHQRLKVCGFDQSYYAHSMIDIVPNIGTLAYRAPEIIVGYSASFSIDVWSTAVVIFEMAARKKLFTGAYNNSILYEQLCLSGNMPMDIVCNSLYGCNHFKGQYFMKRSGFKGQYKKYISNFHKTNRVLEFFLEKYNRLWGRTRKWTNTQDVAKIMTLHMLLEKMLIIDPRRRITIEFVCADPFYS